MHSKEPLIAPQSDYYLYIPSVVASRLNSAKQVGTYDTWRISQAKK